MVKRKVHRKHSCCTQKQDAGVKESIVWLGGELNSADGLHRKHVYLKEWLQKNCDYLDLGIWQMFSQTKLGECVTKENNWKCFANDKLSYWMEIRLWEDLYQVPLTDSIPTFKDFWGDWGWSSQMWFLWYYIMKCVNI